MTARIEQSKKSDKDLVQPGTGRLAAVLRGCGGESDKFAFLYLTNECNYSCDMCYMDSRPGLINTRLNPKLSFDILRELCGIDIIVLSGGEVSLLPTFSNQLHAASEAAKFVIVYTNGTGFLDRADLRSAGVDEEKIFQSIMRSMEKKLSPLPANIEITLPVTEYHCVYDDRHRGHRYAEAIVKAGASLAREWHERTDRPKISFIAKETPGNPGSGLRLIESFKIEGLGSTGAAFPGGIEASGRGVKIAQALAPFEETTRINGGIYINYLGVFPDEPSLLQRLHFGITPKGQICPVDAKTNSDGIVDAVVRYISKYH